MKNILLLILVFVSSTYGNSCIGYTYESKFVENTQAPEVLIQSPNVLPSFGTVALSAHENMDSRAMPYFRWCTNIGTLQSNDADFRNVQWTLPSGWQDAVVKAKIYLIAGDSLGYEAYAKKEFLPQSSNDTLEAPRGFSSKNITKTGATLEWYDARNEDGYRLKQTGYRSRTLSLTKNTTSLNITGLTAGKSYSFELCAYKGNEEKCVPSISITTESENNPSEDRDFYVNWVSLMEGNGKLTATLKHRYEGPVTGSQDVTLGLYLSTDSTCSVQDEFIAEREKTLGGLRQYSDGHTEQIVFRTIEFIFSVPSKTRTGTWYYCAISDSKNEYNEISESNNIASIQISNGEYDTEDGDLAQVIITPTYNSNNDMFTVAWKHKNLVGSPKLYYSYDSTNWERIYIDNDHEDDNPGEIIISIPQSKEHNKIYFKSKFTFHDYDLNKNYSGNGKIYSLDYQPTTNRVPIAYAQTVTMDEDTSENITLQVSDADGDSLAYPVITKPTHGILSGTAPNLVYTPHANYFGNDSFEFQANDGKLDSNVAVISLKIKNVPNTNYVDSNVLTTGQRKSYVDYDDGYYQRGIKRSFTRVGDALRDNITGLIWQDDTEVETNHMYPYNAKKYCENSTLGGYSDWRLPEIKELYSLLINGEFIDDFNHNPESLLYLSNTKHLNHSGYWSLAAHVSHAYGPGGKYFFRCTRGENELKLSKFSKIENKDIVIDTNSKLMWQDNMEANTTKLSWEEAVNYCKNLNLEGYSDWSLPNINELLTLTDYKNENILNETFKYVPINREDSYSGTLWSSTRHTFNNGVQGYNTAYGLYFRVFLGGSLSSFNTDATTWEPDPSRNIRCVHQLPKSFILDNDADGYNDDADAFPNDPNEWLDTDHDGTGNNADRDDDNDGISDADEIRWGFDPLDASDGGNADADGDGVSNADEIEAGSDPLDPDDTKKPKRYVPIMMDDIMVMVPKPE